MVPRNSSNSINSRKKYHSRLRSSPLIWMSMFPCVLQCILPCVQQSTHAEVTNAVCVYRSSASAKAWARRWCSWPMCPWPWRASNSRCPKTRQCCLERPGFPSRRERCVLGIKRHQSVDHVRRDYACLKRVCFCCRRQTVSLVLYKWNERVWRGVHFKVAVTAVITSLNVSVGP